MKTTPTLQQGSSPIILILQTSGKEKELFQYYFFSFRIDDVLFSALSMGSRVVRSHTLGKNNFHLNNLIKTFIDFSGISTGTGEFHAYGMGWNGTLWPGSHAPEVNTKQIFS